MASFSELMRLLPRIALNILPGVMMGGGAASRILQRAVDKKIPGAALTYPDLDSEFVYPINYVGGDFPFENASLVRDVAEQAAAMQSLEEHNAALAMGGKEAEKKLDAWWKGDLKPRQEFSPGSSAVSGVKILPNNKIAVQFRGGGKWYTYNGGANAREASLAARSLLTAPSIGRALVRDGQYAHNGPRDKEGRPDKNIGWWGRTHYDPSF